MFGIQKGENFNMSVLKIIVFLGVFFGPLLFSLQHYYYYSTSKFTFLAALGSLSLGFLIPLLIEKKYILSRQTKIVSGVLGVFLVWLLVTSITGLNFNSSFWSSFGRHSGFLTYFFSFVLFVTSIFIYSKETIWQPVKAFVLGTSLAGISVYLSPILLNVDWNFLINSSRAGTFGNTTYASIVLGFSTFLTLILLVRETKKIYKFVWAILFILFICNPVFINLLGISQGNVTNIVSFVGDARAGFLSLIFGFGVSILTFFSFSKKKIISVSFQIIAVAALVFGSFFVYSNFIQNQTIQNYFIETGDGARLVYWDMAMKAISDRPLLGYGLENYGYIHRNYFDPILLTPEYPNETWTDKPHNGFLELLLTSGFIGFSLFIFLIGYLCILLLRKGLSTEYVKEKIISSLFLGLIVSYLAQIFFAFETVSSIQIFFLILAVILVWVSGGIYFEKNNTSINPYKKIIIPGIVWIVVFVMIYNFSIAVGAKSRSMRSLANGTIQERAENLDKDFNISPVGRHRTEAQFLDYVVGGYEANWSSFDLEVQSYGLKELYAVFEYISKRSDNDPLDTRLAYVSSKTASMIYVGTEGKDENMLPLAKQYAERVIQTSPRDEIGYTLIRDIYILEKNNTQSLKFEQMSQKMTPQ